MGDGRDAACLGEREGNEMRTGRGRGLGAGVSLLPSAVVPRGLRDVGRALRPCPSQFRERERDVHFEL